MKYSAQAIHVIDLYSFIQHSSLHSLNNSKHGKWRHVRISWLPTAHESTGSKTEARVDNSKYYMDPGNLPLLFRAYKFTLKQREMYSSLNSSREQSDRDKRLPLKVQRQLWKSRRG